MVVIIESSIFIAILLICVIIDTLRAVKTKKREWMLLFLFHVLYFFSALYYELYFIVFADEPLSHISEIAWYVSYLFLTLLLQNIRDKEMDKKKYNILYIIPVFTFTVAVGYIIYSEGDVFSNVICALLMWILLRETAKGAMFYKEKYGKNYPAKWLYRSSFIFCSLEYITWTVSCFFFEESWSNPYYWCDLMLALSFFLFIPSVEKIVGSPLTNADMSSDEAQSASRSKG